MSNGYDDCRKHIIAGYQGKREGLKYLARLDPGLAEQVRAVYDTKQAENLVIMDRMFAEEEARQEAFGLAAAQREHKCADKAERDAAVAVCRYPCRTIAEARRKAEYLASAPGIHGDLLAEDVEALLASFTGGDG